VYKVGQDRLRNGSRQIVSQLQSLLPFRAVIVQRKAGLVLIDKGKADGVENPVPTEIIRKGSATVKTKAFGLSYTQSDILGTL